ncbi:hypothetical protein N780_09995 [Pontibacillus chungwhensis BH030062]|uniref:Uncharacterized protein n=1 Tax=Pontibacillus chungwhensis BH030062 TaxID=1385513 RepID=A0A0A2UST9_9BACI|nr:DUF6612 family protein [Pontibacillus chungwhensis]KGP89803.1 hypothetical protein N780_09995 [Pontibacillus chungwhensis BH030062]
MKKHVQIWSALIFILVITIGCSGQSEESGAEGEINKENQDLSAVEVYEKSLEATGDLKSFSLSTDIQQSVQMGEQGEQNIEMSSEGEFTLDPLAYHLVTEAMGQNIEMYYIQDGLYFKDPNSGNWLKGPKDLINQFSQSGTMQQNPKKQLEMLQDYSESLTMDETDNGYVIHLEANEEDMKQFIERALSNGGAIPKDAMGEFTIHNLAFDLTITKEQYYPKSLDMEMEISMEQQGNTVSVKQEINSNYDEYNEIEAVRIPEDVKENAEDISNMQGTSP